MKKGPENVPVGPFGASISFSERSLSYNSRHVFSCNAHPRAAMLTPILLQPASLIKHPATHRISAACAPNSTRKRDMHRRSRCGSRFALKKR